MDIIDLLNEIKVYNLGKYETELVANYLGWKKTDVSYSNPDYLKYHRLSRFVENPY